MHIPVDQLQQFLDTWGYLAVFFFVAIESMGIPFPGETMLITAAVYAGLGNINIIGVIASAASGAIIGDNLGFLAGNKGGYKLAHRIWRKFKLDESTLDSAKKFYSKHGDKTVFLGRFVAILRTWSAFLAGVNQMSWPRFLFFNAAGGIIWASIYGGLGYYFAENVPFLHHLLRTLGVGSVALLILILLIGLIVWKYRSYLESWFNR